MIVRKDCNIFDGDAQGIIHQANCQNTMGSGIAKEIRANERTKDIPIIFLTARSEEADKLTGLNAGGDDYLTKPFSPKELIARIRAILRRMSPQLKEEVLEINGLTLDSTTHRVTFNQSGRLVKVELGPTEFRLLRFFMANTERVHTRGQLLDKVWGDHVFVEERTVDVHIKRLRAVLSPIGCETMIETVRGSGYRLTRNPIPIS
jgi:two-component system phosphate regulon response regulator PhoB